MTLKQGDKELLTPFTEVGDRSRGAAPRLRNGETGAGLVRVACLLLERRRLVASFVVGCALLVLLVTFLIPKKYVTSFSFTPVASDLPAAGLASLAGQFGVTLGDNDPSQTPDFYGTLLQTPDILEALAQTRFRFADGADTLDGTFIQLYDIDEGDSGKTLAEAIRVLQSKILTIGFDRQTSIVSVDVETKWAPLSYEMAQRLLTLINDFNVHSRQTQAGQELRFLTQRLDTAHTELQSAEDRLQAFVVSNRSFATDPPLTFEHDRLQRELNLRQDVYTTLTQAVEQARLRAVRNTPSISLVEHPEVPLRAERRHLLVKLAAAIFGGFAIALISVLFIDTYARGRTEDPKHFASLEGLWSDTIEDVRKLRRRRVRGTR